MRSAVRPLQARVQVQRVQVQRVRARPRTWRVLREQRQEPRVEVQELPAAQRVFVQRVLPPAVRWGVRQVPQRSPWQPLDRPCGRSPRKVHRQKVLRAADLWSRAARQAAPRC